MVTYNNQLESFYMPLKWLHTSTVVLLQYYYILKTTRQVSKNISFFKTLCTLGFTNPSCALIWLARWKIQGVHASSREKAPSHESHES